MTVISLIAATISTNMSAFSASAVVPPSADVEGDTVLYVDAEKYEEEDESVEEDEDEEDEDDEDDDEDTNNEIDEIQAQIYHDRYYTIVDPLLSLVKKEHYLLVHFWKKVSRDVGGMTAPDLDVKLRNSSTKRAGKCQALYSTALYCAALL